MTTMRLVHNITILGLAPPVNVEKYVCTKAPKYDTPRKHINIMYNTTKS